MLCWFLSASIILGKEVCCYSNWCSSIIWLLSTCFFFSFTVLTFDYEVYCHVFPWVHQIWDWLSCLKMLLYIFHLSHLGYLNLLFLWEPFSLTLVLISFRDSDNMIIWTFVILSLVLKTMNFFPFFFSFVHMGKWLICLAIKLIDSMICRFYAAIELIQMFFHFCFCIYIFQLCNYHLVLSYNFSSFVSIISISIFYLFQKNSKSC